MILQATSRDNKLFIAMHETEEPKKEDFRFAVTLPSKEKSTHIDIFDYNKALKQWQSSKREYEVRESDFKNIEKEIYINWLDGKTPCVSLLKPFEQSLEKGIDCTFLKDRLELKTYCLNDSCVEHNTCNNCTKPSTMWALKKVEEENEAIDIVGEFNFVESIAKFLHDTYEEVAREKGWETQESCRVEFKDLPYKNRMTMIAVAGRLRNKYQIFKNPNKQE